MKLCGMTATAYQKGDITPQPQSDGTSCFNLLYSKCRLFNALASLFQYSGQLAMSTVDELTGRCYLFNLVVFGEELNYGAL